MTAVTTNFCPACATECEIRREARHVEYDVRGETIGVDLPVLVCAVCGTEEVDPDFGDDPVELAFAVYRERHGLLTPEEIKETRKRYGLSQKAFAALLGMSEATINRYEGGSLQEATHDNAIRACQSPEYLADLLARRGQHLSADQRVKTEKMLTDSSPRRRARGGLSADKTLNKTLQRALRDKSLVNGFRQFDYQRYAAVVVWFCRQMPAVTTTKLNKLLFYADFLHYKRHALSLTGAKYRRLQHGPVPSEYGTWLERMELDDLIAVREVTYQNGNTGEESLPGPAAEDLPVQFTPNELAVLQFVARQFGNVTPGVVSELSHRETAWTNTPEKGLISYKEALSLSLSLPE